MCDSFIKYANQHKEEIINTFNILHAIPEPAFAKNWPSLDLLSRKDSLKQLF